MSFVRRIKKGDSVYLAKVESYRQDGKVKQKVLEYLGKEVDGKPVKKSGIQDYSVSKVTQFVDIFTLDAISKQIELPDILGKKSKQIMALVYSHLLERVSIYKVPEWIEKTEILNILKLKKISSKDLYESLYSLSEINFDAIQKTITKYFKQYEDNNKTAVLDITDTYFNGSRANWKSRRGKDGKYDKLIQIALAVSFTNGFPIMHKVYEGNINNVKVFEDMINDLKIYGYDAIIVDRGMGSKKNIDNLHQYGLKGILGIRLTRKLGKQYISQIHRDEIFSKDCQVVLKETKVYVKSFDYMDGRLITIYNPNIEIAKKEKSMETKITNKTDQFAGYSLLYTNTDLNDQETVKKYFEKDIVERSFKQLKGALSLHPLRAWNLQNIQSNIKICYLAYTILSLISYKVKSLEISGVEALNILNGGYKVYLEDRNSGKVVEKIVTLKGKQEQILYALNVVYKN
jgi:transposase